jgi:hypothetical protein
MEPRLCKILTVYSTQRQDIIHFLKKNELIPNSKHSKSQPF